MEDTAIIVGRIRGIITITTNPIIIVDRRDGKPKSGKKVARCDFFPGA